MGQSWEGGECNLGLLNVRVFLTPSGNTRQVDTCIWRTTEQSRLNLWYGVHSNSHRSRHVVQRRLGSLLILNTNTSSSKPQLYTLTSLPHSLSLPMCNLIVKSHHCCSLFSLLFILPFPFLVD